MKIGIIGTGVIASAVVRGLAGSGHDICVSKRSAKHAAALSEEIKEVEVADNQTVLDRSDVVFLGLMAEAASDVLASLNFSNGQQVISLMSGMTLSGVAEIVHPAEAAAVMIPFPGIAVGGSPIMVQGDEALVSTLFGAANMVYGLKNDAELEAYMCAQAVLSPAVRLVRDASKWLGERVEDEAQAEHFLRQLVGASLLASDTGSLLEALNTPGGYNARLREHMVDTGMSADLAAGLDKLKGD